MTNTTIYSVFRRNDGYVASVATRTPAEGIERLQAHGDTSFEIVLQTEHWGEARDLIESMRQDFPA